MAGGVVIIALIGVVIAISIHAYRAETVTAVLAALNRKALLVEEQLNRQLLVADQTLHILNVAWHSDPASFRLESFRGQLVALEDTALNIFVADASGIIRESTQPEIIGSNIAARDYFRYEANLTRDDGVMYINPPVKELVTQRWQLILVRRLDRPDGKFAGLVATALPTSALDAFYNKVDLGDPGMIALVSLANGGLLARAGASAVQQFPNIGGSELFAAMTTLHEGTWAGETPIDHTQHIHAFAPIPDRQLSVMVSVDQEGAMRPHTRWQADVVMVGGLAALFVVACCALLLQAVRSSWRREDALAQDQLELRSANAAMAEARAQAQSMATQLEAAVSGMTDGIMILDANLCLVEWNDNFATFTGVAADILHVGQPMEEIIRAAIDAGEFGPVDPVEGTKRRISVLAQSGATGVVEQLRPNGRVLELRRNLLPGGGYVTLYVDITERRLAAERLRQVQTMAEIGQFTAGLAHDFNNLLASVTLNAGMPEEDLQENSKLAHRASRNSRPACSITTSRSSQ